MLIYPHSLLPSSILVLIPSLGRDALLETHQGSVEYGRPRIHPASDEDGNSALVDQKAHPPTDETGTHRAAVDSGSKIRWIGNLGLKGSREVIDIWIYGGA